MMKGAKTVFLASVLTWILLAGCSGGMEPPDRGEKLTVTMAYSASMEELEKLVEEKLPDIDFQWEKIAMATLEGDIRRRLRAGHGPDLVVTSQPVSKENIAYMMPLGGYAFSGRYESTIIKGLSVEGKVYYIPFPGQYNGYVVNKTLFQQEGIPLPSSNEELIEAVGELKERGAGVNESGYNFGMQSIDHAGIGSYIVGCMVPDFLGSSRGVRWLADFQKKEARLSGTWEPGFDLLTELLKRDLLSRDIAGRHVNNPDLSRFMGSGKLAAAYGNSRMLAESRRLNQEMAGQGLCLEYEYGMLPFFGKEAGTPAWTVSMPGAYIGLNTQLGAEENEQKLEACIKVLELISTPEGQQAILRDTGADTSYLKDFSHQENGVPSGLESVVRNGFVYHIRIPDYVIEFLGKECGSVISGNESVEECLKKVDDYYVKGFREEDYDLSVVGSVAEDLIYQGYDARLRETALGNLVADSVAECAGAPMAAVNGGNLRASLYEGDVRNSDLEAVCPYDNQIIVVRIQGQVIWDMLENGVSQWRSDGEIPAGRFLQVSGLRYEFDSRKPAGERLLSVSTAAGETLDREACYEVAVTDYMAGASGYLNGNGDGFTMLDVYSGTGLGEAELVAETRSTCQDALRAYFMRRQDEVLNPKTEGRIKNHGETSGEGEGR